MQARGISTRTGTGRLLVLALLLALGLTGYVGLRAEGSEVPRCERFAAASKARAAADTGSGKRVVVIGDSWSAGLGLRRPVESWPSRLEGRVHVAGFSGSGFSPGASACGAVSFAKRAGSAHSTDLVVVQGGLNDTDQPLTEVRAGFERLLLQLRGKRVVVVGPAFAPARAVGVPSVDALLARLSRSHDVSYISTVDLELPYLSDGLHLTRAGHREYGDAVRERISALG